MRKWLYGHNILRRKIKMEIYHFKLYTGEIIEIEASNYDEARILLYITLKQKGIIEIMEVQ